MELEKDTINLVSALQVSRDSNVKDV